MTDRDYYIRTVGSRPLREAARILGVSHATLSRRLTGESEIRREHVYALRYVVERGQWSA